MVASPRIAAKHGGLWSWRPPTSWWGASTVLRRHAPPLLVATRWSVGAVLREIELERARKDLGEESRDRDTFVRSALGNQACEGSRGSSDQSLAFHRAGLGHGSSFEGICAKTTRLSFRNWHTIAGGVSRVPAVLAAGPEMLMPLYRDFEGLL